MARGDQEAQMRERREIRRNALVMRNRFHELPDFDIGNPALMEERCQLHIDTCMELGLMPTLGSLALALGCPVSTLRNAQTGGLEGWCGMKLTQESGEILRKNLAELEGMFNTAFEAGGYPQPVAGIFAAKNNYGWRDTREVHEVKVVAEISADELASRYRGAIPAHVDPHGETHLLMDGVSANAATKAALGMEGKLSSGKLRKFSGELDSPLMGPDSES